MMQFQVGTINHRTVHITFSLIFQTIITVSDADCHRRGGICIYTVCLIKMPFAMYERHKCNISTVCNFYTLHKLWAVGEKRALSETQCITLQNTRSCTYFTIVTIVQQHLSKSSHTVKPKSHSVLYTRQQTIVHCMNKTNNSVYNN